LLEKVIDREFKIVLAKFQQDPDSFDLRSRQEAKRWAADGFYTPGPDAAFEYP